ncbi:MAG TPA: dihydrodipicolinate synthase family protein [Candidatus Baltobacteraceae bacterium]|nr:dihydrodipicolinate synthase family protein [Candidatus Baltobacteraceae bacterium]
MIATGSLTGVWSAVLTPVDEYYEPDAARAVAYYRDLLHDGIDGINLLGTTGEAMSFSVGQRLGLMEAVAAGLPRERTMCGTGASSLADTVRLTRAASDLGFAAALLMPPFFFRDASDEGLLRFFDAMLSRVGTLRTTILLYNFPRMTGITFHAGLVDRLLEAFPGTISGMKDSSNDEVLQQEILERHPELRVFPSTEETLIEAKGYGAAGCISGSVALWPQPAHAAYANGDAAAAALVRASRAQLTGAPLISLVRARVAQARRDDAWARAMPPNGASLGQPART